MVFVINLLHCEVTAKKKLLWTIFDACAGGSIVGTIAGGIKGQTTEAGFLDGAGKGAITGAIAALELINFDAVDEPISKVNTTAC